MLRALRQLPAFALGPAICRALGHHWHAFTRTTTMRVCDRCGLMVDDPYH